MKSHEGKREESKHKGNTVSRRKEARLQGKEEKIKFGGRRQGVENERKWQMWVTK